MVVSFKLPHPCMGSFRLSNLMALLAEGGGKAYHLYNDVSDLKLGHKEHLPSHIVPHPLSSYCGTMLRCYLSRVLWNRTRNLPSELCWPNSARQLGSHRHTHTPMALVKNQQPPLSDLALTSSWNQKSSLSVSYHSGNKSTHFHSTDFWQRQQKCTGYPYTQERNETLPLPVYQLRMNQRLKSKLLEEGTEQVFQNITPGKYILAWSQKQQLADRIH